MEKNVKAILAIIAILIAVHSFAARRGSTGGGDGVGNGGDVVWCSASEHMSAGLYSLDFVATLESSDYNRLLVPVKSWEESYRRIWRVMATTISPQLAQDFLNFARGVMSNASSSRMWIKFKFRLYDIKDENLLFDMPENCRQKHYQAVIRKKMGGTIIYYYSPSILKRLKKESPLQFSFLMVHEFLWDRMTDSEAIRETNRILHSYH